MLSSMMLLCGPECIRSVITCSCLYEIELIHRLYNELNSHEIKNGLGQNSNPKLCY